MHTLKSLLLVTLMTASAAAMAEGGADRVMARMDAATASGIEQQLRIAGHHRREPGGLQGQADVALLRQGFIQLHGVGTDQVQIQRGEVASLNAASLL